MRAALAIAAAVCVPVTAAAQEPVPQPAPAPAPAPTDEPSQAPGTTAPVADPAYGEKPAPKVDPAYGERPDGTRDFPAPRGKDIVIVSHPDRSRSNKLTLAVIGGSGVLMGAIGFYFHLDQREASGAVAAQTFTGEPWTAAHQADYERAERSGTLAAVFYSLGGGLLLATAITYIVTEPKSETHVIHPHSARSTPLVAPTQGGAIVGGRWSF